MKLITCIVTCLTLVASGAVAANAAALSTDRLGRVKAAADSTYCTITQPKVVISASSTTDNSFYVQDLDRCAGIIVRPQSSLVKVVPGDRVNLAGPVFTDGDGNRGLRGITVTKTAGSEIAPLGMSNKRLYADNPSAKGMLVRTWGKVRFIAGDGDYFYVNDGTTELGIRVVLQSSIGSVTQTAIRGQYVSVCGIVGSIADNTVGGEIVPVIHVRMAKDIAVISAVPPVSLGLSVSSNGILTRNGSPYRGVGVNFFDPFMSVVADSVGNGTHTMTYRQSFKELQKRNIKFCSISAWDFNPKTTNGPGNTLYQTDKNAFFHKLDDVFRAAEDNDIGMISVLFWIYSCVPDMVHESCNQWGNVNSQTIALMKQFVQDYIGHYKDSPSLWGYEFSDELNLAADLHGPQWWPLTWTDLGNPATRSANDEITAAVAHTAFAQFGAEVRLRDANRIIVSGCDGPRPSACHLSISNGADWTLDTQAQMKTMLLADNPDPINTISLHTFVTWQNRFNSVGLSTADWFALCKTYGDSVKKPLYLGSFGAPSIQNGTSTDDATTSNDFHAILNAIEKQGVSIAAVFNYDGPQYGTYDGWNITPTNSRSWMLDAIQAVNGRIQPDR